MSGRLVYSTRWFDPDNERTDLPQTAQTVIVVVQARYERNQRLAALSRRCTLTNFIRSGQIRSHAGASL